MRKRSSSHSPPRTASRLNLHGNPGRLSSSCSGSATFLNHSGNIRRRTGPGSGRKYDGIASPATSRRLIGRATGGVSGLTTVSTTIAPLSELSAKQRFEGLSTSSGTVLYSKKNKPSLVFFKNKRLSEIQASEISLSSSLPNLNSDPNEMESVGPRPRSSSCKKTRPSTPGKSPKAQRKFVSKVSSKAKKNGESKDKEQNTKTKGASPSPQRRVILNVSLPTGSPTFQRAMKGMKLPEKEYSEIFGQKRRDSILQKYTLTESALNSFRDDYEIKTIESSSNAIEKVTVRFQEDLKIYKDGWEADKVQKEHKSILKKRRQSVDDLEIGTRKNLAKYLESKLDMEGSGLLPSK